MRPRPRPQRDTVLEPRVLRPGFHGLVPSQQDWLMTPLPVRRSRGRLDGARAEQPPVVSPGTWLIPLLPSTDWLTECMPASGGPPGPD